VGICGQSPQKLKANNHCNNLLTKTPKIFSAWEFPEGLAPPPPFHYAPGVDMQTVTQTDNTENNNTLTLAVRVVNMCQSAGRILFFINDKMQQLF